MNPRADEFLRRKYKKLLTSRWGIPSEAVSDEAIPRELLERLTGLDKVAIARESLASAKRYAGPTRIWNGYWNILLADALARLPVSTGIFEAALRIGEVPDPHFNAQVTSYGKKRFLLLVQRGLELLLYRLSILMVSTMSVRFSPAEGPDVVHAPRMSIDDARKSVVQNLQQVFEGKHLWPEQQQSAVEVSLSTSYTYAMLQFVIAHELGHVSQELRPTTSIGTIRTLIMGRQDPHAEEFMSDEFAMGVLHLLIETMEKKNGVPLELGSRTTLEAPFIVFRVMEVFEEYAREHGIRDWDTHPPAVERKDRLISHLKSRGADALALHFVEERWQHICELTKH